MELVRSATERVPDVSGIVAGD